MDIPNVFEEYSKQPVCCFCNMRKPDVEVFITNSKGIFICSKCTAKAYQTSLNEMHTVRIQDRIDDAITEITKKELSKLEDNLFNRLFEKIKVNNEYSVQQEIKKKITREIKQGLEPMIKSIAIDRISKIVSDDIKKAAKKYFSNELLESFKEEMISYFINDLKKSLSQETPKAEIKLIIIDNNYESVSGHSVPVELSLMDNVFKYNIENLALPSPSGVYFLYKSRQLQYIGQATCVSNRIPFHFGEKDFDEAYFIPVSIEKLDHVESYLIHKYHPPLNKAQPQKLYRELMPSFIFKENSA